MLERARTWINRTFGLIRLRQFADRLRHRLTFVPVVYVVVAIIVVQLLLFGDRTIWPDSLPQVLKTTVDSSRSVFSALAGGLITSVALVMSMMLVAVQLASSQFSPRTLRDWLGDRVLQHTIGLVLGTTVFCLMALRSTRSFAETGDETVPHITVIAAVALGVFSLVAVVRSVDHLTHSLRIGSVARRIATDTITAVRNTDDLRPGQSPSAVPASKVGDPERLRDFEIPQNAVAVEAPTSGWLQQLDSHILLEALPERSTGYVVASLGGFTAEGAPLLWISPPPAEDHPCWTETLNAFAFGDTRTLQQDVAFGILQLTDVAQRALSPGINDPSTANDVLVHLGGVLLAVWALPVVDGVIEDDDRTLVRKEPGHEEILHRALEPIRRTAQGNPSVIATLIRQVLLVRSEKLRRDLPGPIDPLDEFLRETIDMVDGSLWSTHDAEDIAWLVRSVGIAVDLDAIRSR